MRILVVDDEPDLRFMIRLMLENAGHDVVEVGHGRDALQSVHELPPDLVITDIMMPVMGGLELIEHLRADPATADIPILVVSGNSELAVTVDAVLAKPFEREELVQIASALVKKAVA